jgi:hypothetical protein
MRLLAFFIFYVFLITIIAACGQAPNLNVPEEPTKVEGEHNDDDGSIVEPEPEETEEERLAYKKQVHGYDVIHGQQRCFGLMYVEALVKLIHPEVFDDYMLNIRNDKYEELEDNLLTKHANHEFDDFFSTLEPCKKEENTTPVTVGEATCLPDFKPAKIVDGDLGDFHEQLVKCTGVKNITIIHVDVVEGTEIKEGESHQNYLTEAFFERKAKEKKEHDRQSKD